MPNASFTEPITPQQAQALSLYYRDVFGALRPCYQSWPTYAVISPSILKWDPRDPEFHYRHSDQRFAPGTIPSADTPYTEYFRLKSKFVCSLVDACKQVRKLVGPYCNTNHYLIEYGPFSLLYTPFFEAANCYPKEPHNIFDIGYFLGPYPSLQVLADHVHLAQLWGLGMIVALHCLALHDGISFDELHIHLPNFPIHQVVLGCKALREKQKKAHEFALDCGLSGEPLAPCYSLDSTDAILLVPLPSPVCSLSPSPEPLQYPPSSPPDSPKYCPTSPSWIASSPPAPSVSSEEFVYCPTTLFRMVDYESSHEEDGFEIRVEEDEEAAQRLLHSPALFFITA